MAYSPQGHKESDTTELLHFHFHFPHSQHHHSSNCQITILQAKTQPWLLPTLKKHMEDNELGKETSFEVGNRKLTPKRNKVT